MNLTLRYLQNFSKLNKIFVMYCVQLDVKNIYVIFQLFKIIYDLFYITFFVSIYLSVLNDFCFFWGGGGLALRIA